MKKNTIRLVKTILLEELVGNDIRMEDTLEELGADSLDIIEIINKVEREFNIQIMDEEIADISTVNDLVMTVERKINKNEI